MRNIHFVIILLAITLLVVLFGLGNMALTDPDETFYAQTAKEMLNAGEWTTPLIFGKPQFEKPVLYYWLVMISYVIFGVNEFAARLPSAIFAVAGVIGVYLLGRVLYSRISGIFSGFILITCAQYLVLARACVTDMVLSVFILYSLLFFLLGWTSGKKAHYLLFSVMAGLAVLTKGPIGAFIPAAVVGLYIILSRQWKKIKDIPIFWCLLAFFAVSLPWYIAVTRIHGNAFLGEFFGFRNLTRFLEPEHRIGSSPFYYIPVVLAGFFPWSIFLIFGAWDMQRSGEGPSRVNGRRALLLIWFLTVFLFFSISKTKLVTYILPVFPVMAVVTGRFWERYVFAGKEDMALRRAMNISYYIFIASSFAALAGICFFVRREYPQATEGTFLAGTVFLICLVLSMFLFFNGKKALSFFAIVLAVALSIIPVSMRILPVIEEFESSKAVSFAVKELSGPDEPLAGENDHRRGIAFYTGRTDIVDVHPYHELNEFVARKERVWGIIQLKHYEQLAGDRPGDISKPLFSSGEYVVFNNSPAKKSSDVDSRGKK